MNYLKIKLGAFSLLAILAVSVFLTSCEQQSPILPDLTNNEVVGDENQNPIDFNIDNLPSKEITLSDESGSNSVTLKVSTEDEGLLALYTEQVFTADFIENENFTNEETSDIDTDSEFLHDISEERIKVFIEVSELNLRSNVSFSITTNTIEDIAFRYNIEKWYRAKYSSGMKVRCTGRGIDGLSAYGYHSTVNCNSVWSYFSSKYFYNQNSGSKNFWRQSGKCLWVKTVGNNNDRVTYL